MTNALNLVHDPILNLVVCARHIIGLSYKIPGAMGAGGGVIGLQRRRVFAYLAAPIVENGSMADALNPEPLRCFD